MPARPWLVLLAAASVGVLAGLLVPSPPAPAGTDADDAGWSLPDAGALARFDREASLAARELRWVGEQGKPDETAPAAGWQLAGIAHDPEPTALITIPGATRLQRLRRGDSLPDGTELDTIAGDHIVVRRDGCRWRRALYSTDLVPLDGDNARCSGGTPPPQTRDSSDEA